MVFVYWNNMKKRFGHSVRVICYLAIFKFDFTKSNTISMASEKPSTKKIHKGWMWWWYQLESISTFHSYINLDFYLKKNQSHFQPSIKIKHQHTTHISRFFFTFYFRFVRIILCPTKFVEFVRLVWFSLKFN